MALVLRQLLAIVPEPQRLVNRRNIYDWTPLHILANGGANADARAGMIAQLCQAKADVEARKRNGTTPLMVASATSQFAQAEILMLNGANPNNRDNSGATCRDLSWNNRQMQELLVNTAARLGEGASGVGRQRAYPRIHTDACGEKRALWWTRLYG